MRRDELAGVVEQRGVAPRGWRRPAVSIAAATVAVVSLIGLVWALQGRSTTPPAVQQAPAPTVATTPSQPVGTDAVAAPLELEGFPALDPGDPRNGGAQAVYARSGGGTNQRSTAALVGRRLGDRLVDGIMIVAHRHRDAAVVGPQPVQSTIVGNIEVDYVVEPGTPAITTAIVRGEPTITYSGSDPIGFLMNAGLDAATASVDRTGNVQLRIGELPEGYDVVLPPEPLSIGSRSASLQLTAGDTADGTLILVSVNRPVLGMAAVGDLEAVDINGTPGWISSTAGYAVTWPVGEHTWAVVIGNAALATSIEVARAVEFVDEAEWRVRYDVAEPEPPSSAEPREPAVPATVPASTSIVATTSVQAIDLDEGRTFGIPTISPVDVADTIARIADTLGPSTADTGWLPMPAEFACTGNLAFRTVWWNDFRMTFENGPNGEQTTAWSLGDPSASFLSPLGDVPAVETASGVTTTDGIGIGTSGDELRSRLSSRVIVDDDTDVVVVATGALVTRFTLSDGIVNGIGSGRLDCLDTDEGL